MTFKNALSLSLLTVLLSSCTWATTSQYQKPNVASLPERWKSDATTTDGQEIPVSWWTVFGDPTLNNLVAEGLQKNNDLQAGIERVNQSRAALKIAGASLLPSADATLSAGRTRTNPVSGPTANTTALNGGLTIGYDLDLFGANKAAVDAAKANLSASEFANKSLELATSADITEAYFNLLLTRERIQIAEDNLKNANELLRIIEARVKAGVDSDLEKSQQKVAVANSEAALSALKQNEAVYSNALAILLGNTPEQFNLTEGNLEKIIVPAIAAGQPSTLLERRPDIANAEQTLVAANANINAARAAYYPSITLGLTASGTSAGFGDPVGTAIGLASSLAAPIFAGGRLEGGVEQATARQRELLATYQKTVLQSFAEVENALSAVRTSSERETALKTAVSEAQKAYEISRKRYDVGTIDFATMLQSQSDLLTTQDSYAQAMKARLSASLDLVKALGGGWKA